MSRLSCRSAASTSAVPHGSNQSIATRNTAQRSRELQEVYASDSVSLPVIEMMTTRRAAAAAPTAGPSRTAEATPQVSVAAAPVVQRCVAHQWAAAQLKMIQDDSKAAAAEAAASAAAAKKARAAELAANPPVAPAVGAVAGVEVETPMPKRIKPNVVVLPSSLGAKWKPGHPIPTPAQIAAVRQFGGGCRNVRTCKLSLCDHDQSEVTTRTSASARTSAPVAHKHGAAACSVPYTNDAAMHDTFRMRRALQALLAADTSGSSSQNLQPSVNDMSRTPHQTQSHPHPAASGTLQPVAQTTAPSGGLFMKEWVRRNTQNVGAVPRGVEVSDFTGANTPDVSAEFSASSAISGATRCGTGSVPGSFRQQHEQQQLFGSQQHSAGVPHEQNRSMRIQVLPDSGGQIGKSARLNCRKRLLIHSLDGSSSPEPKCQEVQDFGLRGMLDAPPNRAPQEPHVVVRPTFLKYPLMHTAYRNQFRLTCAEVAQQCAEEERVGCEARGLRYALDRDTHCACGVSQSGEDEGSDASSSSAADSEYDSLTSDEEQDEWEGAEALAESKRLDKQWETKQQGKAVPKTRAASAEHSSPQQRDSGWGAVSPQEVVPNIPEEWIVTEEQCAEVCSLFLRCEFVCSVPGHASM